MKKGLHFDILFSGNAYIVSLINVGFVNVGSYYCIFDIIVELNLKVNI